MKNSRNTSKESIMNQMKRDYLSKKLPQYVSKGDFNDEEEYSLKSKSHSLNTEEPSLNSNTSFFNPYLISYNFIRFKRTLMQSLLIVMFQFLTLMNLDYSVPLPFYPPIGIAFVCFYLLGNTAVIGLVLGGALGYWARDFSLISEVIYLLADIGGGYLGAVLCQKVLSSDIKPFFNAKETVKFFKINALWICPLSGLLRLISFALDHKFDIIQLKTVSVYFLGLMLADLNGILILSGFFLSWAYVFYSREKVSPLPHFTFFLTLMMSYVFIHDWSLSALFLFVMVLSMVWASLFGYLVAGLLGLFCSIAVLIIYIGKQEFLIDQLGIGLWIAAPILLLAFNVSLMLLGHLRKVSQYHLTFNVE